MGIPEKQLETWSSIGSVAQSAATYEIVRDVLNDSGSPYSDRSFSVFLQGSYGNNTNVYRDSDVDIVVRLNEIYYYEDRALSEGAKSSLKKTLLPVQYSYHEFRTDVLAWLTEKFGSSVRSGSKAIFIQGSGSRRNADVLVCARYRRYRAERDGVDASYDEGICFFSGDGTRIDNFPEQHSDNCTAKHQSTGQRFKQMVRIFKNVRNRMVDEKVIKEGLAPSYFIEGMLWNVPDANFVGSYESSFMNCLNWVRSTDRTKLACANDLHWLIRDNAPVCWNTSDFEAYTSALLRYWDQW
jgi:hypothetical protein